MIQIQIKNLADVPEALSLVKGEVDKVKKAINDAAIKALRDDKRTTAREALDYADGLDVFIGKIAALGKEWEKLEKSIAVATPEAREIVRKAGGTRNVVDPIGPKTNFIVRFPDGTTISETKASKVFAKSVERLGAGDVAALGLRMNGEPLLTKNRKELAKYPDSVERLRGGWFLSTHSNTQGKVNALGKAAERLGVRLKIDVIPGTFVSSNPKSCVSRRKTAPMPAPFPYKVGQVVKAVFPVLQRDLRMKKNHVDDLLDASSSAKFKTGYPVFKERKGIPDETRDKNGHHRYYPHLPLVFHGRAVWLTSQFEPTSIVPVLEWLKELGMPQTEVQDICSKAYSHPPVEQQSLPL